MLARLVARAKSLLGLGGDGTESTGSAADRSPAASETAPYQCAVCGTGVVDPGGPCSLCHSTEIVSAGQSRPDQAEEGRLSGEPKTARSAATADEDAARLQAIREERTEDE